MDQDIDFTVKGPVTRRRSGLVNTPERVLRARGEASDSTVLSPARQDGTPKREVLTKREATPKRSVKKTTDKPSTATTRNTRASSAQPEATVSRKVINRRRSSSLQPDSPKKADKPVTPAKRKSSVSTTSNSIPQTRKSNLTTSTSKSPLNSKIPSPVLPAAETKRVTRSSTILASIDEMNKRLNLRKRSSLVKPVDVSPPKSPKLEIVREKSLTSSSQKLSAGSSGLSPIKEKTDEIVDSILPGSNEISEKTVTDACKKIDFKENELQSEIIFTESNVKSEQLSVSGTSSHDKSESCGESEDSGIKEMEELIPSEDNASKAFDSSSKLAGSLDVYEDQNNDPNSKSAVKVDVKQSEMVKVMDFLEYKNSNDIEINPSKHLSPVVLLNRCENAMSETCANSEQPSSPVNTTTNKKINKDKPMTSSEVIEKYNLSDPSISPKSCVDACRIPKSPVIVVISEDGKVSSEKPPSGISSFKEQKVSPFSNSYVLNKNESITDQLFTEIIEGDISVSVSTAISEKSKTTTTEVVKNIDSISSESVYVMDRLNSSSTHHEHSDKSDSEEMSVRVSEKESESVETNKNNSTTNDSCGEDDYSLIVHVDDDSILERRKDVEMFGDSKKNDLQNSMIPKTLVKLEDPETVGANSPTETKTSSSIIGVSSFQNDKTDSTNETEQRMLSVVMNCINSNIVKDDTEANRESSELVKEEGNVSLVTNEPSDEKMYEPECINKSVDKLEDEETNCSVQNNKNVGVVKTTTAFLGLSQAEMKASIKNYVEVSSESLNQPEHEEEKCHVTNDILNLKADSIVLGAESKKEENISCITTQPSSEDRNGPVSTNESYEPIGTEERKCSLIDPMLNNDIHRAKDVSDSRELSEKAATTVSVSNDSENKEGLESINEPPSCLSLSDSPLKKDTSVKVKAEIVTVNVQLGEEGKMSSIVNSNEERQVICESVVQSKLSDKSICGNETDSVRVICDSTSCDESVSEKTGADNIDSSLNPSSIDKNEEVLDAADSKVINQFIGQSPRSIETIGFSIIEKKSNLSGIIDSSCDLIDTHDQFRCPSDVPSVSVETLSSSKLDVAIKSMREQCDESTSEKGFDTSIENDDKIKSSEELDLEGEELDEKCVKQPEVFDKAISKLPTSAKSNEITDLNLTVFSEENEGIIDGEDFENSPHFSSDNETISIPQQKNNYSEILEPIQSDNSKSLAIPSNKYCESNSKVEGVDRTSGNDLSNLEYEEKVIHETTNILQTSSEHSRYEVVRSKDSERSLLDCTSDFETKLEIDVSTRNVNDVHFCVHTKILSGETSVGTTKEVKGSESDLSSNSDSCKSVCGSSIALSDSEKILSENSENQNKNNADSFAAANLYHKGPAGTIEEVQESESDSCSNSDSCKSVRGSSIASSETEKVPSENSVQQDKNINISYGSDATSVGPPHYELPEHTRPNCSFASTAHYAPSRYRDRSYSTELKSSDGLFESENSDETSDSSSENEETPLSGKDFLDDEAEEGDESSVTSSENFPDIIHVGCKNDKSTERMVYSDVDKSNRDLSVVEFGHKEMKFKYLEDSSNNAKRVEVGPLKKIETGLDNEVGYGVSFQEIKDYQTERQGQHATSKGCFFRVQECSSKYLDNLNYSIVTSTSFTGLYIYEQMEPLKVAQISTRNCKFLVSEESDGKIFQSKNANFIVSPMTPDCNSIGISDCTPATVIGIPSTKQGKMKTATSNINRVKTKESKSKKSEKPGGQNITKQFSSCNLSNALSIEVSDKSRKENFLDNQKKHKSNKIISPAEINVKCFGSTVEIENYEPASKLSKTGGNTSSSSPIFTESEADIADLSNDEEFEETFVNTSGGCKHRYTASIQHLGTDVNAHDLINLFTLHKITGIESIDLSYCLPRLFCQGLGFGRIVFSSEKAMQSCIDLSRGLKLNGKQIWMKADDLYCPQTKRSLLWLAKSNKQFLQRRMKHAQKLKQC